MATSLINGLGGTSGFGENVLPTGHANSSAAIDITPIFGAQGLNFFGHSFTSLYVNTNGSVTLTGPLSTSSPMAITAATIPMIAPFWSDVDTRGSTSSSSNRVYYDADAVNGVLTVTWDDVGYYDRHADKLNDFQLQLISLGNGNFDIVFRYQQIHWTTGDASGGAGGLGGDVAVAGYSVDDGVHFFQLPQSGNQGGMLSLPTASNQGIPGIFIFEVHNGDTNGVAVAHDDAYIAAKNTVLHVAASNGVLFNDNVGPPVSATLLTNPTHGTVVLSANGGFDYTPAADSTGIDKFTYHAGSASGSDNAEVVIFVTPLSTGETTTLSLAALTPEQQIAATYAAFFGRGADAPGFQFWVGEFQRGVPTQGPSVLSAIANSFGIGTEAKGLHPFLATPSANDAQIGAFVDSVYNNLFNRSPDIAGLTYWTGQIRQTLASDKSVGSVLVDIMSGAQDTAAGKDITILMGRVAVGLEYVQEQQRLGSTWTAADDGADAKALLQAVTADQQSVLVGVARAHDLVAADIA
jgi:hypothetical protein